MAVADLVRRHRFVAVAIAGGVVGAVIGLFLPIRAADPPKAEEAAWSLPNAQALKRFRDDQFLTVRKARFWGELAMPGRRNAEQPSSWSLHAIVTRPVVQVGIGVNGKPGSSWVQLGGALPDGATVVAVDRDRIWFEKDGCRRVRSLYQDKTKPDADACIGAPAAASAASTPPPSSSASPATAPVAGKPL